jgi:hypothetical protein
MALATPEFLQTKIYSAKAMRAALMDRGVQNGVVGASDLLVSQRAAGANMSVDVAAGSAWVIGQTSARQGIYHIYNDAAMNIAIAANASGNPRLDQVVLHVYDSVDGAAAQDATQLEVIQGTPTAGATLANRSGTASLPATSLLIGDVLVANGAASIANAVIRDRRPWARGILHRSWRNSGDYAVTNTGMALLDGTFFQPRYECSGVPLRVTISAAASHSLTGGASVDMQLRVDGAQTDGEDMAINFWSSAVLQPFSHSWTFTPTAGSHLIAPYVATSGGTATIYASASRSFGMLVEELVRPNINNNPAGYG